MGVEVTGNAALKLRYAKHLSDLVEDVSKSEVTPLFALFRKQKMTEAFGSKFVIPIATFTQATANVDFATGLALANGSTASGASQYSAFEINPVGGASHARVSGAALLQSGGSAQAFCDLGAREMDNALKGLQFKLAVNVGGDGTGSRGRISALDATSVTLTLREDVLNFQENQVIRAAASMTGGAARVTGPFRITSIDPSAGKLFLSGDPTGGGGAWSNAAGGDHVYVEGERSGTTTLLSPLGVPFWIPDTMPAVGSGVDASGVERSNTKLAGHRYNAGGVSALDALIDGAMFFAAVGVTADVVAVNHMDFAKIQKAMEAKRTLDYANIEGKSVKISVRGLQLETALGTLTIIADRTIKRGKMYFLDTSTWLMPFAGPDIVHPIGTADGEDGLIYRFNGAADAWNASARHLCNYACEAPGRNGVVTNYA